MGRVNMNFCRVTTPEPDAWWSINCLLSAIRALDVDLVLLRANWVAIG